MRIDVRFRHIPQTDEVKALAEERTLSALDCFESRIEGVTVRLTDINGPHGGPTKRCTVQVKLIGGHEAVINNEHASIEGAISEATTSAKVAVRRYLSKHRPDKNRSDRFSAA